MACPRSYRHLWSHASGWLRLQEQNRKRQLKRAANQRYYAKQKALKLEAATNISNVHILDELTACGAPTTACGQALPYAAPIH